MVRLFLLCLLFVACAKKPPSFPQETVRLNLVGDPTTLDPRCARDLDSVTIAHMLFEGLTRISRSGQTELALAERIEISEERTTYTFRLRKSFWSNGFPVTAHDFVNTWKTILDPQFPTDLAYQLYVIKNARRAKLGQGSLDEIGIYAKDEQTLVVDLESPIPYFLELVSLPPFFPFFSPEGSAKGPLLPESCPAVFNGPFMLREWKYSDSLSLIKNPLYWESDQVKITGVDFYIASGNTSLHMFDEDKLDWIGSPLATIPTDALPELRQKGKLSIKPFSATYFFRVNTLDTFKGKKNPLGDPAFRRALAISLDREAIAKHVLEGGQTAAREFVPPEMGLSSAGYFSDAQIEVARSLIGSDPVDPITLSYLNTERNAAMAQAIQRQWEEGLGITVELEAVEPKTFFKRLSQKEYQLAASSWTADFNDPINFLEVLKFKDESTNNTGWENRDYIDLLDRSALCKGSEERRILLKQAEEILMRELPIIPIFHFALNFLKSDQLEGVALTSVGQLDLRWAYFKETGKGI